MYFVFNLVVFIILFNCCIVDYLEFNNIRFGIFFKGRCDVIVFSFVVDIEKVELIIIILGIIESMLVFLFVLVRID